MCNPRRICVRATRQLQEAWQREVTRTVNLQDRVSGEARVRQVLDSSLGAPTLRALETVLAAEDSGWQEVEEGYRFEVEGGHITYLIDEAALEIVAVLEDDVQATAQAVRTIEGEVNTEIAAEGEGQYYDDEWGGHTKAKAQKQAQAHVETALDQAGHAHMDQAQQEAEQAVSESVEAEAQAQAQAALQQTAEQTQSSLAEQAQAHLETVGLRGRQAFHLALGQAYKESILAYARRHGADNVQCEDGGDVVEIEFSLTT